MNSPRPRTSRYDLRQKFINHSPGCIEFLEALASRGQLDLLLF